ncbi:small basic protein [Thalassobacillus devorans]|uniref:Small basic protein n=1 Tax=Thalassobacillus devorans TaxID=279813 RepID=A0ABQ1NQ69_9BACI|nr:small basic family protein [Thalassobacillus devorans]NIK27818.1 small basic protein [Thalassobacillus devorans]GGC80680.1 small basic protein [Thalassobacillus devorans]
MWLPFAFLIIGVILGLLTDLRVPDAYTDYLTIAVLAAFDTLLGGIRAQLEKKFEDIVFLTGFFTNVSLAALLAFLGVQLGIDLYLAAVFAFGVRLFQNIAIIRRHLINQTINSRKLKKNPEK